MAIHTQCSQTFSAPRVRNRDGLHPMKLISRIILLLVLKSKLIYLFRGFIAISEKSFTAISALHSAGDSMSCHFNCLCIINGKGWETDYSQQTAVQFL